MSEVATYLKIGTTALVLDMIEDGFFDRDYALQSPVQALRQISHDPTLRESITLKDGRSLTALQIQLEYLECATLYVNSIPPDPATKDILARWTDVLTQLLRTRCGFEDRGIVELAGTVMHYVSFNTIAHGMRLEAPFSDMEAADVAQGGRYEHLLPGGRPPAGAPASTPSR